MEENKEMKDAVRNHLARVLRRYGDLGVASEEDPNYWQLGRLAIRVGVYEEACVMADGRGEIG